MSSKIKSLANTFIEPEFAVWFHAVLLLLWLVPGTVVTLIWLSNVVAWVSWMSLYAIVVAHWSSMQAALAERRVKQQEEES